MKKLLTFLFVFALAFSFVACKKEKTSGKETELTVCLASEPDSIDPALNSAVDGATLLVHLESGLYRYVLDDKGKVVLEYDLAEKIEKSTVKVVDTVVDENGEKVGEDVYENGTRYTVTIKDAAKWSDGTPITADDFIYSWNRAAGSTLAADYCYMFEVIANGIAVEYNDEAFDLAMTKVSDKVFTFDVMVDAPYMDQLLAFPTYFPVKKTVVEKNFDAENPGKWAKEASTYVSCGAYLLDEWVHDSYITLVKNEAYWDAKNIKLDKITFALSDDDAAILASYKSGDYDFIDTVPNEQIDELKAAYPSQFVIAGQMGTYYVSFNVNSTAFSKAKDEADNAKVRKALGLFIDREYIVKEIGKAGQLAANAFVSSGLSDPAGGEFVDHNGPTGKGEGYFKKGETDDEYAANVAEAINLLKEVGYTYDEGTKKFTDFDGGVVYLYNTGSGHQSIAECIRDTYAKYGINIELENQDWATFLNTRKDGEYDIARNGWVADYDDPASYLTMWTTASGNNDSQFGKGAHKDYAGYSIDLNNDGSISADETGLTWAESYDAIIDKANKEADQIKRFQMLHNAETLLMETGAICPIYYYTDIYMIKDNVKGFFSTPLGYKFFMYVTVED